MGWFGIIRVILVASVGVQDRHKQFRIITVSGLIVKKILYHSICIIHEERRWLMASIVLDNHSQIIPQIFLLAHRQPFDLIFLISQEVLVLIDTVVLGEGIQTIIL